MLTNPTREGAPSIGPVPGKGPCWAEMRDLTPHAIYPLKVALCFSGVNFVSLNFIDYVSMALCMGDNRVGDTSDLLDLSLIHI